MKKGKVGLLIIVMLVCFLFAFISYTNKLKNYYINQQLALIGRLDNSVETNDWLYDFFQENTKEDIARGRERLAESGYQNDAMTFIQNAYNYLPTPIILIGLTCLCGFFIYHIYIKYTYKKTYMYYLEQIMNQHYQPIQSEDLIVLQLNQLNDYFIMIEKENELTKKQMQLFIEDIAHQIKTPLTTLRIYIDISNDKKTKINGEKQIQRLQVILDALINLAKLEAHTIKFNFSNQSIEECFEQVFEDLTPLYLEKDIEINSKIEEVVFSYDYFWLSESLHNILKNAIEYSPIGGTIDVVVKRIENKLLIEIKDQGCGIMEEEIAHLFNRFYTTTNPNTRKGNGMGIGLNIAYEAIKAHHGHIYVSSHEGCTFIIELPLNLGKEKL